MTGSAILFRHELSAPMQTGIPAIARQDCPGVSDRARGVDPATSTGKGRESPGITPTQGPNPDAGQGNHARRCVTSFE